MLLMSRPSYIEVESEEELNTLINPRKISFILVADPERMNTVKPVFSKVSEVVQDAVQFFIGPMSLKDKYKLKNSAVICLNYDFFPEIYSGSFSEVNTRYFSTT